MGSYKKACGVIGNQSHLSIGLYVLRFSRQAWSRGIHPFPSNGCVCIDAPMAGMDVSHGSIRVMIDLLFVLKLKSKNEARVFLSYYLFFIYLI